ncbi:MAG: alpha-amylase family glycosyl hydrolase [Candidatus Neomarinimicrobiota bacterium]
MIRPVFLGRILSGFLIVNGLFPVTSFAQTEIPWWNHAVFYEVFVRSFYDSDGDGVGDLRGLIQKLDYLNDGDPSTTSDLGITGIWLMPISQSPSYHGYDVVDYRSVEEDYGTLTDLVAFVDSAHSRGIRVITDLVLNHTSDQHPWFMESASSTDSPFRNWYVWEPDDPGYNGSWGQKVWHYRNGAYYLGQFWDGMPDLNYSNEDMKAEMFDVTRFWLDTLSVDGFRLDAIKHLFEDGPRMENAQETFDFLEEFRQFYKGINTEAMTVGEAWLPTNEVAPYSDGNKVDYCFEFDLASAIINGVKSEEPGSIVTQMNTVVGSYPSLQYATFLTNHDHDRVFEVLSQDMGKMKLAAAIYLTLPGVPFVYYGEEIGMTGSGRDENKRTPMRWTDGLNAGFSTGTSWHSANSGYVDSNVEKMREDENSLWHWYRKLISLRNENETLRLGNYYPLYGPVQSVCAYGRGTENEMAIILHNFRDDILESPGLTLDESDLPAGEYLVTDLVTGDSVGSVAIDQNGGFTAWKPYIELGPKGTALLRVSPLLLNATPGVHDE